MIIVLDASAAIKIVKADQNCHADFLLLKQSDWVIAPVIYLAEIANVCWKYFQFNNISISDCELMLKSAKGLVDKLIEPAGMIEEVFNLSCKLGHPVYDVLYLVTTRRYNGCLLSHDKKLISLAKKLSIKIAE